MKKLKWLLTGVSVLAICIVFAYSPLPYGSWQTSEVSSVARADVVLIDTMTAFGKLGKPPVEFLHDAHTKALAKKDMTCTGCHLTENGHLSQKFKRIKDSDRIAVMNIYHEECISCHGKMNAEREKAGPVECDGCHKSRVRFSSSRQPMGFDKSLHFRHSEAQENKCELCHHEYDKDAKKLFHAKGKEGTCRYCHKTETRDNVISMRSASHMACIDCHGKTQAKDITAGPVECGGCHDSKAQHKIKRMDPVPRMQRKQPDSVLLKSVRGGNQANIESLNSMSYVPFDHKAHETYTNTCRVCHHESLKPCNECHTLVATKTGSEVNLEKAMHQFGTDRSCRGCHYIYVKENNRNCAGCHGFMRAVQRRNGETSCSVCHMKPFFENEAWPAPDQEKAMTAQILQARTPVVGTYDEQDIPDTVIIKDLSDKFEAVDFPHRRIVNALVTNIRADKLAGYFHAQHGTICQGCHHHSPVSKKPPRCASCHGKPFDPDNPLRPGMMGAYHLQCMGCHTQMGMEKPAGCTDCHKRKLD